MNEPAIASIEFAPRPSSGTIPPARRTEGVVYALRNIVAEAKKLEAAGRPVLYLNIGDPVLFDLTTPRPLRKAYEKAIRNGGSRYSPSAGNEETRTAIAKKLRSDGVLVETDDIIVGSGATEAIDLVMTSLLEPGDELLSPCPGYPLYGAIASKLGARITSYGLDPRASWRPDWNSLEKAITSRTRALLVINPGNPTGSLIDDVSLEKLARFAADHGLVLLADEVYRELSFERVPPRLAALAPKASPVVTFDSLSKSHLVPGWRCGWASFRHDGALSEVRAAVLRLADARLCSPSPAQQIVPEALALTAHFASLRKKLASRSRRVERALRRIGGIEFVPSAAAFYTFFRVVGPGPGGDAGWTLRLLHETGLLLVPGSGFGMDPDEGWVRMVTTAPPEILDDAVDRIARFTGGMR